MSALLKIFKNMTYVFNNAKFLAVVIWLVEEHDIPMAPDFRLVWFWTSSCSCLYSERPDSSDRWGGVL